MWFRFGEESGCWQIRNQRRSVDRVSCHQMVPGSLSIAGLQLLRQKRRYLECRMHFGWDFNWKTHISRKFHPKSAWKNTYFYRKTKTIRHRSSQRIIRLHYDKWSQRETAPFKWMVQVYSTTRCFGFSDSYVIDKSQKASNSLTDPQTPIFSIVPQTQGINSVRQSDSATN